MATVRDKPRTSLVLLQSLRAIAAIMVAAFHTFLSQGKYFTVGGLLPRGCIAGEAGVDLFFVISGFIMMHITPDAHRSWRDQAAFLFRRFARIYPPYWAVALPLLVVWMWNPHLINGYANNRVDVMGTFLLCPSSGPTVLSVAWTLGYELSYYVTASFIFYYAGRRRFAIVLLWITFILGGIVLGDHVYVTPWMDTILHPLTLEFIAGMLLAHFLKSGLPRVHPFVAAALVAGAASVMYAWGQRHGTYASDPGSPLRPVFYGVPSLIIVWMMVQMDLQGNWRWLARLAPVGERSYDIYLVHLPVIFLVYHGVCWLLPNSPLLASTLVIVGIVGAVGVASDCLHRWVEKPSHHFARRFADWIRGRVRSPAESLA